MLLVWPHFKDKPFGEGLEEHVGKVSLFSLASPNSIKFYRVESHPSSAAPLATPSWALGT